MCVFHLVCDASLKPCCPSVLVPVQRDSGQRRHCHGGLRGGAGHGKIWLLPEQQHHLGLERTQLGPRGHSGEVASSIIARYNALQQHVIIFHEHVANENENVSLLY